MRPVHAGEGERAERGCQTESVTDSRTGTDWAARWRVESADGEACPCGGGRAWGEGSLLVVRPVHAEEGGRGERGVCWRGDLSVRGRASVGRGESVGEETCPCGGGRAWGERESAGGETCPCGGRRGWGKIRNRIKSTQQRNGFK